MIFQVIDATKVQRPMRTLTDSEKKSLMQRNEAVDEMLQGLKGKSIGDKLAAAGDAVCLPALTAIVPLLATGAGVVCCCFWVPSSVWSCSTDSHRGRRACRFHRHFHSPFDTNVPTQQRSFMSWPPPKVGKDGKPVGSNQHPGS